jgi:hypothetical protein
MPGGLYGLARTAAQRWVALSIAGLLALASVLIAPDAVWAECGAIPPNATPMLNWWICLSKSSDILSGQPEPAEVVAEAPFAKCVREQRAYDHAVGGPGCFAETKAMRDMLKRQLIAHIMTSRAEERFKEAPGPKPKRFDYNRM